MYGKVPHALFFDFSSPTSAASAAGHCAATHACPFALSCLPGAPGALEAEFFCAQCKTPFRDRFPLDLEGRCALCRAGARGFDAAYCNSVFTRARLRELIHLLKYDGMKPLARPLGEFLSRALPLDEGFDAVVAMPLHWRRRFEQGFNQAALLAKHVAPATASNLERGAARALPDPDRSRQRQRRDNVNLAMKPALMDGRSTVCGSCWSTMLLDTGATGSACGVVLKRAGALSGTLLTLARVDRAAPAGSFRRPASYREEFPDDGPSKQTAKTRTCPERQLRADQYLRAPGEHWFWCLRSPRRRRK